MMRVWAEWAHIIVAVEFGCVGALYLLDGQYAKALYWFGGCAALSGVLFM